VGYVVSVGGARSAATRRTNMPTFNIIANGTDMGDYTGIDADAAVEAYARDACYKSVADAASALRQSVEAFRAELRVVEVAS